MLAQIAEDNQAWREAVNRALYKERIRMGDPRFHALLKQIGELHDKKQADYGREGDPFANVRSSKDWNIAPWVGALVRANDKMARLKQFAKRGTLANESAEDSMMDLAVYALIALILYREETAPKHAAEKLKEEVPF